jgi:prepilin-type processing-associated H-X9-DG protein
MSLYLYMRNKYECEYIFMGQGERCQEEESSARRATIKHNKEGNVKANTAYLDLHVRVCLCACFIR